MEEINVEVCDHCGQELQKASAERKEIKDLQLDNIDRVGKALSERQEKLDKASLEMLDIIQRIEKKVGADSETLQAVKELELKLRNKVLAEAEKQKKLERGEESE
jgi:hypothetical protein